MKSLLGCFKHKNDKPADFKYFTELMKSKQVFWYNGAKFVIVSVIKHSDSSSCEVGIKSINHNYKTTMFTTVKDFNKWLKPVIRVTD